MTKSDRTLRALRDLCYGREWQAMRIDLTRRQKERPYVHSIQARIAADLARIEELMQTEAKPCR